MFRPRQSLTTTKANDSEITFDTPVEGDYYRNGGILHTVLRTMAKS